VEEGPTKQWLLATVTKKRNKAKGKWRRHRLAIDRSMDRSAAKKEEKEGRLRSIDCFFNRLATKKNREGAERLNKRMATCDGWSPKKGTRREAKGDGTGLRSIGIWIDRPPKKRERRPLAFVCLFFRSSCHNKRQRRSREAEQKNGRLRGTVTKKRNKARGQRRRLAIDRSMDRSAAKKRRERRPLAID